MPSPRRIVPYAAYGALLAVIWAMLAAGHHGWESVMAVILLQFAGAAVLAAVPVYSRVRIRMGRTSADSRVTVSQVSRWSFAQMFVRLEQRIWMIRALRTRNADMLMGVVMSTGRSYDVDAAAARATRLSVAVFVPCVAASAVLGIYVWTPLLLLAVIPAAPYFAPYVGLRMNISERKSKVNEEMAYFLCYANIMQGVGRNLYFVMRSIRGMGVFGAMETDASEIIKKTRLGYSNTEALELYARHHPVEKFKAFLDGYMAKLSSVGEVPEYTSEKARSFFEDYRQAWLRYERSAQEILAGIMMFSIILPMMIIMTSLIATAESASMMMIVGTTFSPVISVLVILMLNGVQPRADTDIPLSPYLPAGAGAFVAVTMLLAGVQPGVAVSAAAFTACVANSVMIRGHLKRIRTIDSSMPEFMIDVREMSKTGDNINQIIIKQSGRKAYRKEFNDLLRNLAAEISQGTQFPEAVRRMTFHGMQVRFVMFLLSMTYRTGADTASIFHSITEFVISVDEIKAAVRKSLVSLTFIIYLSPFIVMVIVYMMMSMFSGGSEVEMPSSGSGFNPSDIPFTGMIGTVNADSAFTAGVGTMVAAMSIPMGFVASKIVSFSIRDTVPVAITSASAMAAIIAVPMLSEVIISPIMSGMGG